MKKLQTGIFAIIALLTMSFVVVEHEGVFDKPAGAAGDCQTGMDASQLNQVLESDCTVESQTIDCLTAEQGQYVKVSGLSTVAEDLECEGTLLEFCCAELGPETECGTNGQKVREITKIICGERIE